MKAKLGSRNCLFPMPTTLVGALVNGKPNYITIAYVGIMDHNSISLSMNKSHYTNAGIKETNSFSVNIPSVQMMKETDYCGIVTGKNTDKSGLFTSFYGRLGTAPMIQECPINMECRLIQTVDFPRHDVFMGEIVETYCDENCITDGIVDFSKVQPLLFIMEDKSYNKLGDYIARAWRIGLELKKKVSNTTV
jgi:flavin reductase (DIM6/NTAB) family NADH-FMN oxidoreductase RutF